MLGDVCIIRGVITPQFSLQRCSSLRSVLAPLMLMEQHQRVPGVAPHLSLSADSLHLGSYQCKYLVRSIAKVDAMIL